MFEFAHTVFLLCTAAVGQKNIGVYCFIITMFISKSNPHLIYFIFLELKKRYDKMINYSKNDHVLI